MQGAVVRFRSADHLFQTIGGGSPCETLPIHTVPEVRERAGKKVSTTKVLVIVGLVVGVILYSAKLVDDHLKEKSEAAIAAETTAKNQAADDTAALSMASEVNKKWETTFDKTGKYPERQSADTHNAAYGSVVRIAPSSPSYAQARVLVDKFAVRQLKINQAERRNRKTGP